MSNQIFCIHLCDVQQPFDSIKLVDGFIASDEDIILMRFFYDDFKSVDLKAEKVRKILTLSHYRCPVFIDISIAPHFYGLHLTQTTVLTCDKYSEDMMDYWFGNSSLSFLCNNKDINKIGVIPEYSVDLTSNKATTINNWKNIYSNIQRLYPTPYLSKLQIEKAIGFESELVKLIKIIDQLYLIDEPLDLIKGQYVFNTDIIKTLNQEDVRIDLITAKRLVKKSKQQRKLF